MGLTERLGWRTLAKGKSGGTGYKIIEKKGRRLLTASGIIYSALNGASNFSGTYHDYFLPLPLLFRKPHVLVIGLGAGTIPFLLSRMYGKRVRIDVAETDRECIRLAGKFLPKGRHGFRIIHGDGAKYVVGRSGSYDIIIQDAFVEWGALGSLHIPSAFLHDGFISDAADALSDNGILAINYAPNALYLPIYLRRLRRHFRHVYRMRHIFLGSYIIVCSKSLDRKAMLRVVSSEFLSEGSGRVRSAYMSMH